MSTSEILLEAGDNQTIRPVDTQTMATEPESERLRTLEAETLELQSQLQQLPGEQTSPDGKSREESNIKEPMKIDQYPRLRRTERTPRLTEKARQNKEEELVRAFRHLYNDCRTLVQRLDIERSEHAPEDIISELIECLKHKKDTINLTYQELRDVCLSAPPADVRQGVDKIIAEIDEALSPAKSQIAPTDTQSEHGRSLVSSRHTRSSVSGVSDTSSRKRDAAARAAALRVELEAQEKEAECQDELKRMELERAEMDAMLDMKRRQIERQRITKELHIEEAKLRVYEEAETQERCKLQGVAFEISSVFSEKGKLQTNNTAAPEHSTYKRNTDAISEETAHVIPEPNIPPLRPPSPVSHLTALTERLLASVSASHLPPPEPTVFSGNPLEYPDWEASFCTLIESRGIAPREKIHYLKKYLGGPAREAVSGFFLLKSDRAFERAKQVLEERYGNPFVIAEAFRDKLDSWPKIGTKDHKELRRFSDFLGQCDVAMMDIKCLEILNDNRENRKLVQKLPDWLVTRWSRLVVQNKKATGNYPSFSEFAGFVSEEADIACDPVVSLGALRNTTEKEKDKFTSVQKRNPVARNFATETCMREKKIETERPCLFCNMDNHVMQDCRKFAAQTLTSKHDFIKKTGLCFGCLRFGHISKNCMKRPTCKKCGKKHPTCLHMERRSMETTVVDSPVVNESENMDMANVAPQDKSKMTDVTKSALCRDVTSFCGESVTSMIVPVWVSSSARPDQEHLVYALLDTQSDSTFILDHVGQKTNAPSEPVQLRLTTMTSKDKVVQCKTFSNLMVRGFNSQKQIPLPITYSREYIPVDESHIPTPDTAKCWPHLEKISHKIQPLQDCEVGLLIGYNCPQALAPRNCITGEENQPFAVETELGWSIVGTKNDGNDLQQQLKGHHPKRLSEIPNTPSQSQERQSEEADLISNVCLNLKEKSARHISDLRPSYNKEVADIKQSLLKQKETRAGGGQELHEIQEAYKMTINQVPSSKTELLLANSNIANLKQTSRSLDASRMDWQRKSEDSQVQSLNTQHRFDELQLYSQEREGYVKRLDQRNTLITTQLQEAARLEELRTENMKREQAMMQKVVKDNEHLRIENDTLKAKLNSMQNLLYVANKEIDELKRTVNKLEFESWRFGRENDLMRHKNVSPSVNLPMVPMSSEETANLQEKSTTSNHLLTMKSEVFVPPPGNFVRQDLNARKKCSTYRSDKGGTTRGDISRLMT